MKKIYFSFIVLVVLSFAQPALAKKNKEASDFFNRYVTLSDNFDVSVASLYSDNAKIHAFRHTPDGLVRVLQMTGTQWKELVVKVMPVAKESGDISKYSNITFSTEGDTVKIKAERYSVLKCFTDKAYYMVVEKEGKEFKIIEEYIETYPQSTCGESEKDEDLKTLMKRNKKQIKALLPLMLDEDTRLDKVKTKKTLFQYQYTLVNLAVEDLNADEVRNILLPIVTNQACTLPILKKMIDKGATVSFLYNGKNGKEVVTLDVTNAECK